MESSGIEPRPQLLTYPDSLGGDLRTLGALLDGPLAGLFHGVHILPPFPSSGDRGFAPLTYAEIDPRFGTWADIERIAEQHDVLLDLMINHISRARAQFQDFLRRGRQSPYADLFITLDKVWPDGDPLAADVARIFLRNPTRRSRRSRSRKRARPSGSGRRSVPSIGPSRSISTSHPRRRVA